MTMKVISVGNIDGYGGVKSMRFGGLSTVFLYYQWQVFVVPLGILPVYLYQWFVRAPSINGKIFRRRPKKKQSAPRAVVKSTKRRFRLRSGCMKIFTVDPHGSCLCHQSPTPKKDAFGSPSSPDDCQCVLNENRAGGQATDFSSELEVMKNVEDVLARDF